MIKHLYLENFKTISKQRFDFGKVNILCGPNNSGKSTVLAAINLIAQSVIDNSSDSVLVLNGRHEELGTYQDLIFGHNVRSKLVIEIGVEKYIYRYEFKYRTQKREIEVVAFRLYSGEREIYSYKYKNDSSYDVSFHGRSVELLLNGQVKRRPEFRGLLVRDPNAFRISLGSTRKEHESYDRLDRELGMAMMRLKHAFSSFDSLGAFRERPSRTHLFSGQGMKKVGRTGAGAIDLLVSDRAKRGSRGKVLLDKISEWFHVTGMAKALELTPLTSRHFEVSVKDQAGKSHNLCDVGFGCSQVLPVLVAAYSFIGNAMHPPILVIQEPEIHLHPNAQAELGSMFADVANAIPRGQIFIETHSPYLIIRLQTEVAKGGISNTDIKVFYVKKDSYKTEFTELLLQSDGIFKDEWPDGFFSQRSKESLELARETSKAIIARKE